MEPASPFDPTFKPDDVTARLEALLDDLVNGPGLDVTLTKRLATWLTDLRLLRRVPLAYLVPDPRLLPPESIRFFHVDPNWTDRLVDGALAAANLGTLDMAFTPLTRKRLRETLDQLLGIEEDGTMTGMLIRSELVERWPDLIVQAFDKKSDPVPLLRQDVISRSIMIVLFNGVPAEVRLRESHVGLRFGVEADDPKKNSGPYHVPGRDPKTGVFSPDPKARIPIDLSVGRTLDVKALLDKLPAGAKGARGVALRLQRPPSVQSFVAAEDPDQGSKLPYDDKLAFATLKLRRGREIPLDKVLKGLHRLPQGGQ